LAVDAIELKFLIHIFPARRLFPPVLMAEPPARPHAAASALSESGRDKSRKSRLEAGNRCNSPTVRLVHALDPGRSPIERARA